ncbi:MAG: helix-turn-helix transcriptional regulator [Actinomycetota bacterium]|nr:helix-turn-helix transcriptional regulator [Actinomycetota bacterium]
MSTLDRIERICGQDLDERALRIALLEVIRARVPCDAYAWVLTDPETLVGSAPLAETPSLADVPALIRLKYLTVVNRWTGLSSGTSVTLLGATGGDRSQSRLWNELLSGYGIDDVASTVFGDAYGCWAFLDLWRRGGPFTDAERDFLGRVGATAAQALRRSLAATFALGDSRLVRRSEPVLLLLSDDLVPLTQTPQTDAYLRALLPTEAERAPVPAGALHVGAQLLAQEQGVDAHPAWARVHLSGGVWVTLRAARMVAGSFAGQASIAVTIEPTPPTERTALYARATGLSERETQLLRHLVGGSDTHELARRLFVSEHTVQDHLKSVFAKTGAANRRVLVARATGAVQDPVQPGRTSPDS